MTSSSTQLEIDAPHRDDALRAEVIQFFINLAQALSFPKSVGEILGTLYCSPNPLSFNDLIEISGTSKASLSQGLRTLKNINAIKSVNVSNDRRSYFRAELNIDELLKGFLTEMIRPQLRRGANQLSNLQSEPTENSFLKQRIDGLHEWHRRTCKLLSSLPQRE